MNCIIIDDEPKALDILEVFISKIPFINLLGRFRDPVLAMDFIIRNKPDLVFSDINMPDITGLQLIKSLSFQPLLIFTTAYSEYAVESYELNAVDYLLKPIEFERFLKAVIKAKELFDSKSGPGNKPNKPEQQTEDAVYIKSGTKIFRVGFDDILFVEGMGNYVNFVLKGKKIMTYLSLKEVLNLLPSGFFCRIHKSYVISLKHIETIEKDKVVINKTPIPIGVAYREHFSEIIKNE